MARTQVAADDFNRADGNLSGDWAQLTSNAVILQIENNELRASHSNPTPGAARWVGAGTFTADQYSSLEITNLPVGSSNTTIGVICRASADTTSGRDYYIFYVVTDSAGPNYTTTLAKVVDGTTTVLHSASAAWALGDLIELEVEGTTVRAMKNGTALGGSFTQTDSDLSAGQPGVAVSGVSPSPPRGDNWTAGDVTAAASVGHIASTFYRMMERNN